jgi:hypothetical protein
MNDFDRKVGNLDEKQWDLYVQLKEYIDEEFTHAEMKKLIKYKGQIAVQPLVKEATENLIMEYEEQMEMEEE